MLDNQYFKKYLNDRNIDLKEHMPVEKLCELDIDPKEFEDFIDGVDLSDKKEMIKFLSGKLFDYETWEVDDTLGMVLMLVQFTPLSVL